MTAAISIEFDAQLNDLLPSGQRHRRFDVEVKKPRSVKDLIESMGVPHTEIDLIIIDGQSVGFEHPLQGDEKISVYGPQAAIDMSALNHLQTAPLSPPRFVLDVHLGRLAAYLRMLRFDTLYRNDYDDPTLADISAREQRILLTCDVKLLMRKQVQHGHLVRSRIPRQQIQEVIKRYRLHELSPQLARCISCNGIIHAVDRQQIESLLEPLTKKHYQKFYQCADCKKIYWEGSHFKKIELLRESLTARR